MREKVLETVVVGFLAGVFVRSYVPAGFPVAVLLLLAAVIVVLVGLFFSSRWHPALLIIPLILAAFSGGIARYALSEPGPSPLDAYSGKQVTLEGVVAAEPDVRDTETFLTIALRSLDTGGKKEPVSGKVRISVDAHAPYLYGDLLKFTGLLRAPQSFETSSGSVFDYPSYLAKDGIYYELYRPKVSVLGTGAGNPVVASLLSFKHAFLASFDRNIPEPESGLASALILGNKRAVGNELTSDYRRAGIAHIIVLSGYHLSLVSYWLTKAFSFLPGAPAAGIGALGVIAFTIMAGASATAVRAAIMALIALLATVTSRRYRADRALYLAAFLMVAENPKLLAFDPSFQLSFLAAVGLVYLSPYVRSKLARIRWIPERFGIKDVVAATIATQLFVLPRLVAMSGMLSFVSIVANVSILPLVPLTMLGCALAGVAGFVGSVAAVPFSLAAFLLLRYQIAAAQFFGGLPFAAVMITSFSAWALAASYAALAWFAYRVNRRAGPRVARAGELPAAHRGDG